MELDRTIDITAEQRKIVLALIERHLPNTTAWVYGSRAKWTARPQSDLDLVVFATPEQNGQVGELREAFEESDLPFRVDLFVWDSVPEQFRKHIKRDHVVLVEREERDVSGGRRCIPASEFCASVRDGTHDSPKPVERGRKLVTSRHLTSGQLNHSEAYLISEEDFEHINKRSKVDKWDVLISMIGTVGEACLIKEEPDFAIKNIGLFKTRSEADGKWLYYYLRSKAAQKSIREQSRGTTQQYIPLGALRAFPILVADGLEEQKSVVHILGTLDEKIELNRRMNETLEAMARALFKSWFVDFDPVRAKMAGRDIGLPKHLADLFPDRLVESELGEIPEGWEVAPFSECIEVVRGLSYKGSHLSSDGVPMHNLNSIYEGGGYKYDGLKGYDGAYKSQHVARAGDVIIANTEQGHDRLLIGYAAIVPTYFVNETIFSHHIYRVRPKGRMVLTSNYLCQLLNTRVMHEIVSGFANGTTVNMLPMDALQIPQIVAPSRPVLAAFNDLAEAVRGRQEEMTDEFSTLAALLDTLLPKLVSGELRANGTDRNLIQSGGLQC